MLRVTNIRKIFRSGIRTHHTGQASSTLRDGSCSRNSRNFFLPMHAKSSFAHRLQAAKMASSRTSAQNNGPRAQKNGPWV